ncbi:MAG: HD domain-containing protein [Lachnospiraceae bacterium]|nr:HD domain-containing protein [Lachnospiraceae bacterium]
MGFIENRVTFRWCTPEVVERILAWQDARGISREETERCFKDILTYGREILDSDEFAACFLQTHHYVSTVGDHTLHVTLHALSHAYELQSWGHKINLRDVVTACLCHDIGILGRHGKFANDLVCCYLHPIHSALAAKRIVPKISRKALKAISRHMFPAFPIPPVSWVGYLLIKADKYCAYYEMKKDFAVGATIPAAA